MKRFLVFAGDHYYPCGGWNDLRGQFDTLEEARGHFFSRKHSTGSIWWII